MGEVNPAGTSDLGVVDPLHVPYWDRLRRTWTGLPILGRGFIVAAVVDLVFRLSGRVGLPSYLDLANPLAIVTGFIPHYAVILFPVVILLRRPDAAHTTPVLLRGAAIVAVVGLLRGTLPVWLSPTGGDITAWMVLELTLAIAGGAGYIVLARGLQALGGAIPSPSLAGLANLVAGLIGATAIVSIVVQLARPSINLGDPGWDAQALLASTVGHLPLLAFAYLARAVLLAASDVRRPREARILAATGMLLSGIDAFLSLAVGLLVLVQDALHVAIPVVAGGFVLALLGTGFVLLLLVIAFALGLGDVSGRIARNQPPTRESTA